MIDKQTIAQILIRLRRLEIQQGGGGGGTEFTYFRPDGVSGYNRPTGPFTYIRP